MGRFSLLNFGTLKVRGQELGRSAERDSTLLRDSLIPEGS